MGFFKKLFKVLDAPNKVVQSGLNSVGIPSSTPAPAPIQPVAAAPVAPAPVAPAPVAPPPPPAVTAPKKTDEAVTKGVDDRVNLKQFGLSSFFTDAGKAFASLLGDDANLDPELDRKVRRFSLGA